MKYKFLIPVLLLAGFAGITSCGDNADSSKDAEIAALKARIAAGGGTVAATGATVTTTAVATVTVNTTVTNTSTSANTARQ